MVSLFSSSSSLARRMCQSSILNVTCCFHDVFRSEHVWCACGLINVFIYHEETLYADETWGVIVMNHMSHHVSSDRHTYVVWFHVWWWAVRVYSSNSVSWCFCTFDPVPFDLSLFCADGSVWSVSFSSCGPSFSISESTICVNCVCIHEPSQYQVWRATSYFYLQRK